MQKKISIRVLLIVVFLGLNLMVLFGWVVSYAATERGDRLGKAGHAVLSVARFPQLVHRSFAELVEESPLLINDPFPDLNGFKLNGRVQAGAANDDGYLLQSVYDNQKHSSVVKLIRISDAQIMHQWAPDIAHLATSHKTVSALFDSVQLTPRRYRIVHPLLVDDASLAFAEDGPLFKIDACSSLVQTVDGIYHHAKEADGEGNIWTASVMEPATLDKRIFHTVRDDAIAKISPTGAVLLKKSVASILIDNGYRGLLIGVGDYQHDLVHLNAVKPALVSTRHWQKGDLLLSLRSLSTVLLYRPSTNKILWLQTGPWLKQHDPQFVGHSRISIFGNDVIDSPRKHAATFPDGANNIYIYDFENGRMSTPYAQVLKRANVQTVTEGRATILENGDAVVEESNRGRTLRVSTGEVVWQYTSKASANQISVGAWSSYLTKAKAEQLLARLKHTACP